MTSIPLDSSLIIEKIRNYLAEDTEHLLAQLEDKSTLRERSPKNGRRGTRKQFASYLVSVATHPIGLRASVSPYNCSQEQMLAYLMETFKFNQAQLSKMLDERESALPSFIKKHSWRPEIKYKVGEPAFYDREQEYIDNLSVRVYLFPERPKDIELEPSIAPASDDTKQLLDVFQNIKLDPAILIRPVDQMIRELRFRKPHLSSKSSKSVLSDQPNNEGSLNVKRNYSEPKTGYILRFEFWLKSRVADIGALRRVSRYLVHSNFFCPTKQSRGSIYSSTDQVLYGFVNVKLNQVPAYAMKMTYPIMSMREQRVNTSEISLEFRNRRIVEDMEEDARNGAEKIPSDRFIGEFIINHMRLYVNCLIYQLISLGKRVYFKEVAKDVDKIVPSLTVDNLFYLPAHTLVNQHRLQSNLKQLEDQSLRRSAILMLLAKMDELKMTTTAFVDKSALQTFQLLLVDIAQHEFVIAHRLFDGNTMQQIEIFQENLEVDASRDVVIDIELAALSEFFKSISEEGLSNSWLSSLALKSASHDKILSLSSLRLAKMMITHVKTNTLVSPKLKAAMLLLEEKVDKVLRNVVSKYLRQRLERLLSAEEGGANDSPRTRRNFKLNRAIRMSSRATNHQRLPPTIDSWQRMSLDLQQIDHDLSLYWSAKGVDHLAIDSSSLFGPASASNKLIRLTQLVKSKMDRYLAEPRLS